MHSFFLLILILTIPQETTRGKRTYIGLLETHQIQIIHVGLEFIVTMIMLYNRGMIVGILR